MSSRSVRIRVLGKDAGESDRLTNDLRQWLMTKVSNAVITREKEAPETQDAGSVLIAVLTAPAMVEFAKGPAMELAKGIADWLRKRRTDIEFGGTVVAHGLPPDAAEKVILEALRSTSK